MQESEKTSCLKGNEQCRQTKPFQITIARTSLKVDPKDINKKRNETFVSKGEQKATKETLAPKLKVNQQKRAQARTSVSSVDTKTYITY
eukprot:6483822-Amphidinium_carterae.1